MAGAPGTDRRLLRECGSPHHHHGELRRCGLGQGRQVLLRQGGRAEGALRQTHPGDYDGPRDRGHLQKVCRDGLRGGGGSKIGRRRRKDYGLQEV